MVNRLATHGVREESGSSGAQLKTGSTDEDAIVTDEGDGVPNGNSRDPEVVAVDLLCEWVSPMEAQEPKLGTDPGKVVVARSNDRKPNVLVELP
jgi:hypothetical protein